jgi:hypothetical protein
VRKDRKRDDTSAHSPHFDASRFQGGLLKATLTPATGGTPLHLVVPTSGACDQEAFLAALHIPALLTHGVQRWRGKVAWKSGMTKRREKAA